MMPVISALNTEPRGPTHLNMIEMAAPSYGRICLSTVSLFTCNKPVDFLFFFPMSPSSYPFASFKQEIKKYEMSLMERLLPEMGCSVQPKAYSPTSYLSGRKAPHQLCTLSH